jgi:hypothetical protein
MPSLLIESDPATLQELHEFIYERNEEIEVEQETKRSHGAQLEPIVVAILIAVTPIVTAIIKEYFEYKKTKLAKETEIKLSIKEGNITTPISPSSL